ncbi:DsbA family protein [Falsiroseomonas stagni]|uniref:Protein-disulfide isomerase n=1 Tax=Falsiroseomonas stagni DSM 19981 TaxID=1123062 RepID=A0A1I3Y4Y2_9PROT|nr:DsbA family protein [Falsiroseomonas stagni]SFK26306.1 Protein-disulfide isomerase [Falsiroseomonas stagni DSM 19981]
MTRSLLRPVLALCLVLIAGGAPAQAQEAPAFTAGQRAEILGILRQALREDPSIIREALAGLEEADRRDRSEAQRAAIAGNADALFRDAADPSKGNARGDITIVEFFDARCGYCKQLQPAMDALLRRDPNVRVVLKDLPILGPNSVLASRALLAAQRQGRYVPLYDALLSLRTEPTEAVLRQQAERAGLDWSRLRRDMDDPAIGARIERNLALAQRLGIEGTPALIIGNTLVPGAIELPALERLVAEARAALNPR